MVSGTPSNQSMSGIVFSSFLEEPSPHHFVALERQRATEFFNLRLFL
jgi:hypothetical protein